MVLNLKKQVGLIFIALSIWSLLVPKLLYGKTMRGMDLYEGLDDLVRQVTRGLSVRPARTIIVADFRSLNGDITALGRFMAEEIIPRLFDTGKVQVIERGQLEKALEELKFSQTDLFDPSMAKKLGKFVGADAILAGTITDLGSVVRVHVRVFSTERGEVLAVGATTIVKDDQVGQLIEVVLQPSPSSGRSSGSLLSEQHTSKYGYDIQKDVTVPSFETDVLRVTVKSLRRSGSRLVIELWYENLTDQTMKIAEFYWRHVTGRRESYVLSDTGEKWIFERDTQIKKHYGGIDLIPHQRLLNKITFVIDGNEGGSRFTYVGKYSIRWKNSPRERYHREVVEVIIRDIPDGYSAGSSW